MYELNHSIAVNNRKILFDEKINRIIPRHKKCNLKTKILNFHVEEGTKNPEKTRLKLPERNKTLDATSEQSHSTLERFTTFKAQKSTSVALFTPRKPQIHSSIKGRLDSLIIEARARARGEMRRFIRSKSNKTVVAKSKIRFAARPTFFE